MSERVLKVYTNGDGSTYVVCLILYQIRANISFEFQRNFMKEIKGRLIDEQENKVYYKL